MCARPWSRGRFPIRPGPGGKARKPSFATFQAVAKPLDGRNPEILVKAGTTSPELRFAALELYSRSGAGANVGLTIAIYDNGRLIKTAQRLSQIGVDGWISFEAPFTTARNHTYQVTVAAVDLNGNRVDRSILVRVVTKK